MTQRGQNGNCFCSKAAMRQQQSLTISATLFRYASDNLAHPRSDDLASSRKRDRLGFVAAIERTAGALARAD
jgi:hypothetical protein